MLNRKTLSRMILGRMVLSRKTLSRMMLTESYRVDVVRQNDILRKYFTQNDTLPKCFTQNDTLQKYFIYAQQITLSSIMPIRMTLIKMTLNRMSFEPLCPESGLGEGHAQGDAGLDGLARRPQLGVVVLFWPDRLGVRWTGLVPEILLPEVDF